MALTRIMEVREANDLGVVRHKTSSILGSVLDIGHGLCHTYNQLA